MSLGNDKSFYCFICNKIFTSEERRYQHFEKHINYNRFKCRECDSQFSTYDDLECHQECLQHFDFEKTTNLGIRKLITLLAELSLKIESSSDIDSVEFLVTIKTENSKSSDSKSLISNDNKENTTDSGRAEDESLNSSIKAETLNSITVEKNNGRNSTSSNILNGKENLNKSIKIEQSEYLCLKSIEGKKIIEKNVISNKSIKMERSEYLCLKLIEGKKKILKKNGISNMCLQCNRTFVGGKARIQHVFKHHMMLKEFKFLECIDCLNQKGNSKRYFDISSLQEHYINVHKISKKRHINNLACDYNGKRQYIHFNGSPDLLYQYETQFAKCFVSTAVENKKS